MAELLATGTSNTASADITLTAGQSTALLMMAAAGPAVPQNCFILIEKKSGSQYFRIGYLTADDPCRILECVGTFRVRRENQTTAIGVDRD
jgi:hypothetical protein